MSIIIRPNEKLIKTVRRHWIFMLKPFASWLLLIIGLLFVRYALKFTFFNYWPWVLTGVVLIVALILWYKYQIWRNNVLVITDQRIVENEQRGFFSKTVTELLYSDVLEISYDKEGMSASFYNYGDIKIRTASENDMVLFDVPAPRKIVEVINQVRINRGNITRQPVIHNDQPQ